MSTSPSESSCPICSMNDLAVKATSYECMTCGHEWARASVDAPKDSDVRVVKDAHGNVLQTGDDVVLIKDLKLRGSSTTIKGGTKIKRVRIVDGDHEVDCKVDGMSVMLKAMYLKKA